MRLYEFVFYKIFDNWWFDGTSDGTSAWYHITPYPSFTVNLNMPTQYTDSQMRLFNALVKRGLGVLAEHIILRDGEFNSEGKPKSYVLDLLVDRFLVVEVEGLGSASADNKPRDDYLHSKGFIVKHVSNAQIKKDLEHEVECIALIVDGHKRRFSVKDVANELYNYGMYQRENIKLLVSILDHTTLAEIHRAEKELGKVVR